MKTDMSAKLGSLALIVLLAASACAAGAVGPTASDASRPPDVVVTSPPNGGGGALPGDPQPQFVVPRRGQLEVHAVGITHLSATVAGHSVTVQADWWSGVEPCNVLDSIQFVRSGGTFTVSLFEGHGPQPVMCIEIAVLKATTFGLGDLEPGAYTIRAASGDAQPITITVT